MCSKRNLVSRSDGDLLAGVVAAGADVDQIDANFLQLFRKDCRLLKTPNHEASQRTGRRDFPQKGDTPESPFPVSLVILVVIIIAPLLTLKPVRRADTVKDWLIPCGARGAGDLERKAESIGKGAAVGVGAVVGEGGDVVWEVVSDVRRAEESAYCGGDSPIAR